MRTGLTLTWIATGLHGARLAIGLSIRLPNGSLITPWYGADMAKTYHTLYERDSKSGKWLPQFGDYSLAVVKAERRELHEGWLEVPLKNMKIVTHLDNRDQMEIARELDEHETNA